MAIWQYQLFLIPKNKISSIKMEILSESLINSQNWWEDYKGSVSDFDLFKHLLGETKSWHKRLIIYGSESSNCLKILMKDEMISEVTLRLDLSKSYAFLIKEVIDFCIERNISFINHDYKIIQPNEKDLSRDIEKYPYYRDFLKKIGH